MPGGGGRGSPPPVLHPEPHLGRALTAGCGVGRYFNRDVECIRRFFRRRFRYESNIYPRFRAIKSEKSADGSEEWHLDLVVCASGYDKGEQKVLEEVRTAGSSGIGP